MPAIGELLYATHSRGKLAELARLAPGLAREVRLLADLGIHEVAPEEGSTFLANAVAKATFYAGRAGMPALADDSGLCIDALDGAPGLHTARFLPDLTQEARNLHLAARVGRLAAGRRGATFACALALVIPGSDPVTAWGEVQGEIAPEPRGAAGFGYDPVFLIPGLGKTFGEIGPEEKDALSHRGRAFRQLQEIIDRERRQADR